MACTCPLVPRCLLVDLADTLSPEVHKDEPKASAPVDPVAEPVAGDTVPLEGIVALPFVQKALLAGAVLALLAYVLRRRRRSNMMVNEKSLA